MGQLKNTVDGTVTIEHSRYSYKMEKLHQNTVNGTVRTLDETVTEDGTVRIEQDSRTYQMGQLHKNTVDVHQKILDETVMLEYIRHSSWDSYVRTQQIGQQMRQLRQNTVDNRTKQMGQLQQNTAEKTVTLEDR